jgi:tetratricopeptide (TPR) repeat protein
MAREQYREAAEQLDKAREINPVDEETLARVAALLLLTRRAAEFDRLAGAVQQRNPTPSRFYFRIAERLEDHRRFDQAEAFFLRAIEAGPDLPEPRTGLGMLFMRVGKEAEAAATLEQAFAADPFNVRTKNMLEVLDQLRGYQTVATEHFHIKVDAELDALLGKYAAKYLEQVYGELTERFGFRLQEQVSIEIFNKGRGQTAHQWFSARTVGLPWIGTVGACTGKVIAMASPRGVQSPYNWARVLKHELVHVITLQQTRFHIPHWYTEALAVQAEGYPRPQVWNQLLVERVPAGQLFTLDNINLAFARPKSQLDWQMAYCQSELYAEYMESRFGPDSSARLLSAYRDGLTTPEAIDRAFQVTKQDFEAGYREFVVQLAAGLSAPPPESPLSFAQLEQAYSDDPENPDVAARLAHEYVRRRAYPKARELAQHALARRQGHPLGSFVLARLSMLVGDTDRALEVLEPGLDRSNPDPRVLELMAELYVRTKQFVAARELYELAHKRYPTESRWVAGLARVGLLSDDQDLLVANLEQLCLLDADDVSPRKKLASLAAQSKDWERVARYAWMTIHIDVADAEAHILLGDASAELGKWPDAADEYLTARALRPGDPALPLKLARAYLATDNHEAAREIVKELLARDPEHRAARELWQQLRKQE